jgi:hypothetical protein
LVPGLLRSHCHRFERSRPRGRHRRSTVANGSMWS